MSASSHASSCCCSALSSGLSADRTAQAAAWVSISTPFPEPQLTLSSILGTGRCLLHSVGTKSARLRELLLDRALGVFHMFGDSEQRQVSDLLQLERLSACLQPRLQYFLQRPTV